MLSKPEPKKQKKDCIVEIFIPKRTQALKARLKPVYCHCEGDIDKECCPRIACLKCQREYHIKCLALSSRENFLCENCKPPPPPPPIPVKINMPAVSKPKDPQEIRISVANIFASIAQCQSFLPASCTLEGWAKELEDSIFQSYNQSVSCLEYKTKVRSLSYNLKDPKNTNLRSRIFNGEITPMQLVEMSPDQLANEEIGSEIKRCKEQSLQNSVIESEKALKQILFPNQQPSQLYKKDAEGQFFSTLEQSRLHHAPTNNQKLKSHSLIPVPLAKCPQKLDTFFRSTWNSLRGTLVFDGFESCEFSASLVGANCWISREALWETLGLSNLRVEKSVDRDQGMKFLHWAQSKKPLIIFGLCSALKQVANEADEKAEEEGECSNFENLFAHFTEKNAFGLLKKDPDSDCAKEIYLLPWRKDQNCHLALFGLEGKILNSFAWSNYSETGVGMNLPPALKSDGFLVAVVIKGQLICGNERLPKKANFQALKASDSAICFGEKGALYSSRNITKDQNTNSLKNNFNQKISQKKKVTISNETCSWDNTGSNTKRIEESGWGSEAATENNWNSGEIENRRNLGAMESGGWVSQKVDIESGWGTEKCQADNPINSLENQSESGWILQNNESQNPWKSQQNDLAAEWGESEKSNSHFGWSLQRNDPNSSCSPIENESKKECNSERIQKNTNSCSYSYNNNNNNQKWDCTRNQSRDEFSLNQSYSKHRLSPDRNQSFDSWNAKQERFKNQLIPRRNNLGNESNHSTSNWPSQSKNADYDKEAELQNLTPSWDSESKIDHSWKEQPPYSQSTSADDQFTNDLWGAPTSVNTTTTTNNNSWLDQSNEDSPSSFNWGSDHQIEPLQKTIIWKSESNSKVKSQKPLKIERSSSFHRESSSREKFDHSPYKETCPTQGKRPTRKFLAT
jgi:hypothetical protein